ncbi:hypothetical protein ZWY2020_011892 [Hordeum vulgare]|nr:hypothetical protein ZWY2020_011892 [Hordeum vulgare]
MASARLTPNGMGRRWRGTQTSGLLVNPRCVRWRGLVSDGVETCPTMFAAEPSDQARSELVRRGSLVQLDEYVMNMVSGRRRKGGGGGGRTRTPPAHAPFPAPIDHHPPHVQLDLDRVPRRQAMAFLFGALLGLVLGVGVVMAFRRLESSRAEQHSELSAQIPLDVIWNDGDHMDARKDLTLSPVNYSRPKLLAFLDMLQLHCCGVDLGAEAAEAAVWIWGRRSVRRGAGFVEGLAPLHREAVDAAATPEAGRSELGGWSAFMVA